MLGGPQELAGGVREPTVQLVLEKEKVVKPAADEGREREMVVACSLYCRRWRKRAEGDEAGATEVKEREG